MESEGGGVEVLRGEQGVHAHLHLVVHLVYLLGDPEVTADIYCKSRNLPNTVTQNYSTDLR